MFEGGRGKASERPDPKHEEAVVTIEEARKLLEEAENARAARPWEPARQQQVAEARARLARVQRHAERHGQMTLEDVEAVQ